MLDKNQFGTRAHSAMAAFRIMVEELAEAVATRRSTMRWPSSKSAPATAACSNRRTRPKPQARIENLNELMNAAAEAVERGETVGDFLDHAALVAEPMPSTRPRRSR